jgi:hypothetical protein
MLQMITYAWMETGAMEKNIVILYWIASQELLLTAATE